MKIKLYENFKVEEIWIVSTANIVDDKYFRDERSVDEYILWYVNNYFLDDEKTQNSLRDDMEGDDNLDLIEFVDW